MLALAVHAPFAVCRTFTAGWFRPTAAFLTPSAAYGLVLNLAGIETRLREENPTHPGTVPASVTRPDLPTVRLALGALATDRKDRPVQFDEAFPRVATVYQQLHNYPVGKGNKVDDPDNPGTKVYQGELAERRAKGNKSNITPVRRELLVNLRAAVMLDGNPELETAVRRTLAHGSTGGRYGLPFLGDNSFLPDRIDPLPAIPEAYWFEAVSRDEPGIRPRTARLTAWIDRADMSKTVSHLFAPADTSSVDIPPTAWVTLPVAAPE